MTNTPPRLSLDGMLDFIPKSKRPLAPIFEAISNGLEAILDRRKTANGHQGEVTIKFYFTGLLHEARKLERIEVCDNGIGFNSENYQRFGVFLDRTKGFNNRGSGRVQFLHFAEKTEITSHYAEAGATFKRHFFCNPKTYITDPTNEQVSETETGSIVALSEFCLKEKEKNFFEELTLTDLRNTVKNHYMLRLHLDKAQNAQFATVFHFEFYKNNACVERTDLLPDDIPVPSTGQLHVPYVKIRNADADTIEWVPQAQHVEQLSWAHFKLDDSDLAENGVVLCSKNVVVDRLRFDAIKKTESFDGHRFLTAIYGEILDSADNVDHTVDHFTFPKRGDTEKAVRDRDLFFDPDHEFLFFDDIEQAVENVLPQIYADLYAKRADQEKDVEAIARAHGIPPEVVQTTKINISDTEAQITEKLFKKHAESMARQNLKIKQLFESLDTLNPVDADYQTNLETRSSELLELIPEQNKRELSRYIIRRQMVAKVLGMILDQRIKAPVSQKTDSQTSRQWHDREGLIHDLVIKRKSSTGSGPNDLWILNEEFVHFEGYSNISIDKIADGNGNKLLRPIPQATLEEYGINPKLKPDIFLYLEEGQCILIELKSPEVDLADYLNQLPKYCNLIANFCTERITQFYCYLIGENLSPIAIGGDYRRNVHGDWTRRNDYPIMRYENGHQDEEIGKVQVEIIRLSSIYNRALRRNESFADRLGIGDDVLEKCE